MSLTIELPASIEADLKTRAAAAGQNIESYAAQLLERTMRPTRSIREISGEVGERFARSGETEEELAEELERVKHEMRAERRKAGGQ